jgi:2-oxoglutarate-Fe(II)-dependent oxygenase superfamily protein
MSVSVDAALPHEVSQRRFHVRQTGLVSLLPTYSPDGLNEAVFSGATVDALRAEFDSAFPFPHVVIDGLFSPDLLERIASEYGSVGEADWIKYDNANELKLGTKPNSRLGPASQSYFDTIHRAKFTRFLTAITGIEALVTDPMLRGGGLHEIPVGGKFGVHTDFTRHVDTKLDNRLVFITYLNKGWQEEWGGALELWTSSACVKKVLPVFGRSILFAHTEQSLHGHPDPVNTPDGRTRRSVAAYFYTNGRPDPTPPERLGTRFLNPAVEPANPRKKLKKHMKLVLPPVLVAGLSIVRNRIRSGK